MIGDGAIRRVGVVVSTAIGAEHYGSVGRHRSSRRCMMQMQSESRMLATLSGMWLIHV
jgi:hypothetical protein